MRKRIVILVLVLCLAYIAVSAALVYSSYNKFRIDLSNFSLNKIQYDGIFENLVTLRSRLKLIRPILYLSSKYEKKYEQINDVISAKPVIDQLTGFDSEKIFLVLMQNNAELRPSGGFWGSYGIMRIKDGAITSFKTSDTYSLDLQNRGKFIAPDEIKDVVVDEWRFWNANWSPDFKDSVEKGLFFYKQVEPTVNFDGVIGPNVDYLLQILKVSGPIDVPEHNFKVDENNFMPKMIYEPSDPIIDFSKENNPNFIYPTDKKPLLADLAKNIFEVISKGGNFRTFLSLTHSALEDKNLLLYFPREDLENRITELGWAGRFEKRDNFIKVVDANLGSKLDFFIDKKLVIKQTAPCEYEGQLTYSNEYNQDSKIVPFVNYRDLIRIFLPKDSTLIDFKGGQRVPNISFDSQTDTSYLSTLLIVGPRESSIFTFRWKTAGQCEDKNLVIEKQSGSHLTSQILR